MKLYRLYTEYKDQYEDNVIEILRRRSFNDFTIYRAFGHWNGLSELSLVVEIVKSDEDDFTVDAALTEVANSIKSANHQASVLITKQDVTSWLV